MFTRGGFAHPIVFPCLHCRHSRILQGNGSYAGKGKIQINLRETRPSKEAQILPTHQPTKSNKRHTSFPNLQNLSLHPTSSFPNYSQYREAAQAKLGDLEQALKQAQATATELYQDMILHYRDPSDIYNAWVEAVDVTFEYVAKMEEVVKEIHEVDEAMEKAMEKKIARSAQKTREVEAERERVGLMRKGKSLESKLEADGLKANIRKLEAGSAS